MPKVCSNGLQNLKLTAKKEKGMQGLFVRGISRCLKPKKKTYQRVKKQKWTQEIKCVRVKDLYIYHV